MVETREREGPPHKRKSQKKDDMSYSHEGIIPQWKKENSSQEHLKERELDLSKRELQQKERFMNSLQDVVESRRKIIEELMKKREKQVDDLNKCDKM